MITDIHSPGMCGLDFLSRLRLSPQTRDTRVFVISGNIDRRTRVKARRLGALEVFVKPFDLEAIVRTVDAALRRPYEWDPLSARAAARRIELSRRERTTTGAATAGTAGSTAPIATPRADPSDRPEHTKFIAVLDDCPGYRELMSRMVLQMGFQVVAHPDKAAFLEVAPVFEPVVVISDVQCPGMDGIEFLMRWRADDRFKDVPVIVVTGYINEGDPRADEALRAGAFVCIPKPPSFEGLHRLVREALSSPKP